MKELFQEHDLEAYLGDHIGDFDVEAIIDEATEIDYKTGNRYWRDGISLNEICERNDKAAQRRANLRRTYELYKAEHYELADGTSIDREKVTVRPYGKTLEGRTVWADVDDDSIWYTYEQRLLWKYYGDVYR